MRRKDYTEVTMIGAGKSVSFLAHISSNCEITFLRHRVARHLAAKVTNTIIVLILAIASASCATTYSYQPSSPDDPKIIFGERFGGTPIGGPVRSFGINISLENLCQNYEFSGVISNDWTGFGEKTREYFVPKNKKVLLTGSYMAGAGDTMESCDVGPVSFIAEAGKIYSIDILGLIRRCLLVVEEKDDTSGKPKLVEVSPEPECER